MKFRRSVNAAHPGLVRLAALAGLAAVVTGCGRDGSDAAVPREYMAAVAELERFITREMADKKLPAISIAIVDDQRILWSRGFGMARPADSVAATAETVHRVGSVSKLFTDIAVMQLVERGELDLDAPVTDYLPDFRPRNPYGKPITLRQLMAHRSGLVREPPVGNYFDSSEPSLAATIASLNSTALVYEPETRAKYSNAAIATVGYVVETVTGEPLADYMVRAVLRPAGLNRTSFLPRDDLLRDLATAYMWGYDQRQFEAPTFQLGMMPAGSMYSTVNDLGRFMSTLFAGGAGPGGRVLGAESIEAMWTPQWPPATVQGALPQATGFGLGFYISQLDGHRRIGHGGAIYGFATELAMLPEQRIGVIAVTTMDASNIVVERIADAALRLVLAARAGEPLPAPETTKPLPAGRAAQLAGRYTAGDQGVDLVDRYGQLLMMPIRGGFRTELRASGTALVVDDRLEFGTRIVPAADRLILDRDTLTRVQTSTPPLANSRWHGLIGEYGWNHNILYILEKDERLHALIEWFYLYPLEEVSTNVFRFPNRGLYDGESLIFTRGAGGRATRVEAASVVFPRRAVGTESGVTFRIEPVRPVAELRAEAMAATPPVEAGDFLKADLVELNTLDPSIKLDVRYASTNNFMSSVFYQEPRAFLQRPAAEALVRAHRKLSSRGYGLLVYDAYRPWYVTKTFWDATPEKMKIFVANPALGSRHNRGAAVDLTLFNLTTGQPIEMVGGYDEFSDRSFPGYPGGTSRQRWYRELLREVMEAEGFRVYDWEWWHFDYGEWPRYPILNLTFDQIAPASVAATRTPVGPGVATR